MARSVYGVWLFVCFCFSSVFLLYWLRLLPSCCNNGAKCFLQASREGRKRDKVFPGPETFGAPPLVKNTELANRNGINHPFSKETKMAGIEWARGFMRRFPELSLRTPEPTSMARIAGFNRVQVQQWTPDQLFNIDETGITVVQKPGRILAANRYTSGSMSVWSGSTKRRKLGAHWFWLYSRAKYSPESRCKYCRIIKSWCEPVEETS